MSKFNGFDDGSKQRRSKKGKDYRDLRREDLDKFESVTRRKTKHERHTMADGNRRPRHNEYLNYDLDEYSEDI